MTKAADVVEAERLSKLQRVENAKLIEVDEQLVTPTDRKLVDRVTEIIKTGGDLDEALVHPGVNQLFNRGVLRIRRSQP